MRFKEMRYPCAEPSTRHHRWRAGFWDLCGSWAGLHTSSLVNRISIWAICSHVIPSRSLSLSLTLSVGMCLRLCGSNLSRRRPFYRDPWTRHLAHHSRIKTHLPRTAPEQQNKSSAGRAGRAGRAVALRNHENHSASGSVGFEIQLLSFDFWSRGFSEMTMVGLRWSVVRLFSPLCGAMFYMFGSVVSIARAA